ncbi:hypothetical protein [Candidatus Mesenet endosymbiont of Agriotes lineatus]|uniref:hypothetical protein n=1 Tax=Candidatus Mesenet endosymbiont of Agriotes lineatus TaxID=3077948 RepID=UPI0030CEABCD
MGIAIFDRSRSINDPMVIAGGVFICLTTLSAFTMFCILINKPDDRQPPKPKVAAAIVVENTGKEHCIDVQYN